MAAMVSGHVRSNVIAFVALFVALGGSAWAGTEHESSVKPNPLKGGYGVAPAGTEDGPFAPRDCSFPRVRPTRIVLRCDSFGIFINGINWKSWENTRAKGKGLLRFRDCRPSCRGYPVKIELHKVRGKLCSGRRQPMFRRIRLHFPDRDPNVARTNKLECNLGP